MGRLFENPWVLLIIIIVVVLLFAAPKLPGMARSLGQSMRIIKSEVKEMKNDGKPEGPAAGEPPVEGRIVSGSTAAPQQPTYQQPAPQQPTYQQPAPQQPVVHNPTQPGGEGTGTTPGTTNQP